VSSPEDGAAPGRVLCCAADIPEGGGRGFVFGRGAEQRRLFVVRHQGALRAYRNACPHVGTPLDFVPDRFFDPSGTLLQCATHGARFRVDDGYCVAGPCAGKRLSPVEIVLSGEFVLAPAL
jgi:nitrite reductase/ring-hydroxylating ferredoxin subunit